MRFLSIARSCVAASILGIFLLTVRPCEAYSLLTHEALIDLTWDQSIVPLLRSRYPHLTPTELEQARAYAYGGCVIQDIGYYPFGDLFFSNLTHYVRSGDFVVSLFRNAHNTNELAFAVGALSHYIGDNVGHSGAVNLAVPVEFPKLKARYGASVSYAEGKHQHVQTEFAFDIDEISHRRLAPLHYLQQVGLKVPTQQLALAFYETYGLREDFNVHRGRRINVRAYRFAVHGLIPHIAYALTLLHRHTMAADDASDLDLRRLQQEVDAVAAHDHWDKYRKHAGIATYTLAGFIYIVPKFGPLRMLAIKGPTAATEEEYVRTVIDATDALNRTLRRFTPPSTDRKQDPPREGAPDSADPPPFAQRPRDPRHPLPNRDLDTGAPVKPGGYPLTDQTYADLLHRIAAHPQEPVPPGIKADILAYYADPNAPITTRDNPQRWAVVEQDLATLRNMPTSKEQPLFETYDQ